MKILHKLSLVVLLVSLVSSVSAGSFAPKTVPVLAKITTPIPT